MGDDDRKLFVGRLPDDIREDEIHFIFNTYGVVERVKILDKGSSKAAFVTYASRSASEAAVQVLNNVYRFRTDSRDAIHVSHSGGGGGSSSANQGPHPATSSAPYGGFGGGGTYGFAPGFAYVNSTGYPGYDYSRYGHAGHSDREYDRRDGDGGRSSSGSGVKIYVANLPEDITKDHLEYVFNNYGRVEDIHVLTGRSKSGRLACFVIYSSPDSASKCIAAMQSGYEIRPGQGDIQVKYASDQRTPRAENRDKPY